MSHEISDTLFDALQSEVCPAPTLPIWGAHTSNGALSDGDRTLSTSDSVLWACARSDVFHSAGKHTFALDLTPDTPSNEELVAGFGNPAVDVDHDQSGGIHGGSVNAFNSWCITDDGYTTHGNDYSPQNPALFPCSRLIGRLNSDIGYIWLSTNAPGVDEAVAADAEAGVNPTFIVGPGVPLAVVMSAYRSNAGSTTSGVVAGSLVAGFASGSFAAW